jgi:hypothetical protein
MEKKTFVTNTTRLVGKTYRSVEEMPPDVRRSYEHALGQENEDPENPETAEVTEILVHDKKYASIEELPPDLRETCLQAMAAAGEIPGKSLARIIPGRLTQRRTITIIEDRSANVENAGGDAKAPGLGSFLAILAGATAIYAIRLSIPGMNEPWEQFLARLPTWGSFFRGWTFIVLPIAAFLWLGMHFFQGRLVDALSRSMKIVMALLILLIIAMILSALCW